MPYIFKRFIFLRRTKVAQIYYENNIINKPLYLQPVSCYLEKKSD
jgi:hypothetical protein